MPSSKVSPVQHRQSSADTSLAVSKKKQLTDEEYQLLAEGKKRNPLIEKNAKQLLATARKQLKTGVKKVKIVVNGKPTEVTLVTITSGWALVKDASGDTYGIELDAK